MTRNSSDNSDMVSKIIERLRASEFWTEKTKFNQKYISNLKCSQCDHTEAWAYSSSPFTINCNRQNQCGARIKTLSLFPEIIRRIEREFPPTKTDPHRPAREYLRSRGLNGSLEGVQLRYFRNVRKTGSGAAMFLVGVDEEGRRIFNGRLFNPPGGEGKTHNKGSTAGRFWKHPAIQYDPKKKTYATEGIMDALSLIEIGQQAIAILSAGQDPAQLDLGELAHNLVIALDNDCAGAGGLKRWKERYPKASAIAPPKGQDWNDVLLRCGFAENALDYFEKNQPELKFNANLLLAKNANQYASVYKDFRDHAPGLFEFEGCYWWSHVKPASKKSPEQLIVERVSNFTLKVDHYQLDSSIPDHPTNEYHLKITSQKGQKTSCTVTGGELSAPSSLRSMLLTRSRVLWEGEQKASLALCRRIVESEAPVVRQLQILGHDLRSDFFVFSDFAIGPGGEALELSKQGFVEASRREFLRPSTHLSIKPRIGAEPAKVFGLIQQAWPLNGPIAVSYVVSSWFVNKIKKDLGFFPFLEVIGDPQTGKTRLVRILNAMQCIDEEGLPMTKLNTGKGEIRKLAQRSGLFIALLEGNKEERIRFDLESILPLYNHGNPLQIRALKTNSIETHATDFLSSLIFVQNRSLLKTRAQKERVISCPPFTTAQITKETTEAFNQLIRVPIRELGYFFVFIMMKRKFVQDSWLAEYEKALTELITAVPDNRIAENHAVLLAFHNIITRLLNINLDLKDYIVRVASRKVEECSHQQATLAHAFFEAISELDKDLVDEFLELKSEHMYVKLAKAIQVLEKQGYKLGASNVYRDLKDHPAFLKSNAQYRGYFGSDISQSAKVWVFDHGKV